MLNWENNTCISLSFPLTDKTFESKTKVVNLITFSPLILKVSVWNFSLVSVSFWQNRKSSNLLAWFKSSLINTPFCFKALIRLTIFHFSAFLSVTSFSGLTLAWLLVLLFLSSCPSLKILSELIVFLILHSWNNFATTVLVYFWNSKNYQVFISVFFQTYSFFLTTLWETLTTASELDSNFFTVSAKAFSKDWNLGSIV